MATPLDSAEIVIRPADLWLRGTRGWWWQIHHTPYWIPRTPEGFTATRWGAARQAGRALRRLRRHPDWYAPAPGSPPPA